MLMPDFRSTCCDFSAAFTEIAGASFNAGAGFSF